MTRFLLTLFFVGLSTVLFAASPSVLHSFDRLELSDEYYAEGANIGDFNNDGKMDIVAGPFWYAGPSFKEKHEIYKPVVEDRNRYSYSSFFSFVYDLNGDGWTDVLGNGLPGRPAHYYENPGKKGGHWKKHQVFDWVSNESPTFTQLVGDERPELVCTRQGVFGYVEVNWAAPEKSWYLIAIMHGSMRSRCSSCSFPSVGAGGAAATIASSSHLIGHLICAVA